jgi:predicted nucleic-acid-binding protein
MPKLAVDTNVVARALVIDGSEQSRRSQQVFRDNVVFVPESVLLETEWVLRSAIKLDRQQVNSLLVALVSSRDVEVPDRPKSLKALAAHQEGMDFADALHLLGSAECDAMASFDREFAKRAATLPGVVPVHEPM